MGLTPWDSSYVLLHSDFSETFSSKRCKFLPSSLSPLPLLTSGEGTFRIAWQLDFFQGCSNCPTSLVHDLFRCKWWCTGGAAAGGDAQVVQVPGW